MSKRVSHSLLDPWVDPPVKACYGRLGIPVWFPPEGIVGVGHLSAMMGAVGFAMSSTYWWGGVLFATAALTNIKAKMIGEFTLATFGPTKFKTGLVVFGITLTSLHLLAPAWIERLLPGSLCIAVMLGGIQLLRGLLLAVKEVNDCDAPPDTTEWETVREKK